MSYYLGIDASLTSPGFCIAECNKSYVQSDHYKSKATGFTRIQDIKFWFLMHYLKHPAFIIVANNDFQYSRILIEGHAFSSKGSFVLERAELVGVIKNAVYESYCKNFQNIFIVVPPTVLKKFATGKGNCDKSAMILQTFKEFKIEFENNDECDAFWLAQIGRAMDGHWNGLSRNKAREEIVKKLRGE